MKSHATGITLILCMMLILLAGCNYPLQETRPIASPTLLPVGTATSESVASASATPSPSPTLSPTPTLTQTPVLGDSLPSGDALQITKLHMLDASNGWGVGQSAADVNDHVLATTDGGATWIDRTPLAAIGAPPSDGLQAEAYFLDGQHAWVTYSGTAPQPLDGEHVIWRTQNGGLSWSPSRPLSRQNLMADFFMPSDLQFLDAQHGWMMAHLGVGMSHDYFAVYATQDGGDVWERVTDPETQPELMACYKSGMDFITETDGWLGGNCPGLMPSLFLYRTTDGGRSWNKVGLPVPDGLKDVSSDSLGDRCGIDSFTKIGSSSTGFVLACPNFNTSSTDAWLYQTPEGSESYSIYPLEPPYNHFDFLPSGEGWRLGTSSSDPKASGEILHTTDRGATWVNVREVAWHGDIDFIDGGVGWVLAQNGDQRALVTTDNGGELWQELQPVVR